MLPLALQVVAVGPDLLLNLLVLVVLRDSSLLLLGILHLLDALLQLQVLEVRLLVVLVQVPRLLLLVVVQILALL